MLGRVEHENSFMTSGPGLKNIWKEQKKSQQFLSSECLFLNKSKHTKG